MRIETALRAKRARVVAIRMSETVMVAMRRLRSEDIGILAVKDSCGTEGDVVLGMLSERDILQAIVDHGAAALSMPVSALSMPVSALMTHAVVSCHSDDTVDHALGLMNEHHIRHLPVFHGEALVGVISIRDVLALATTTEPPCSTARGASVPMLSPV